MTSTEHPNDHPSQHIAPDHEQEKRLRMKQSEEDRLRTLALQIRKDPSDLFSHFALGLEFLKRGDRSRAGLLFETIHRIRPEYPGLAYHYGRLCMDQGDLTRARDLFEAGIRHAAASGDHHTRSELLGALQELED